jgi:hypothetical protein
MPEVTTVFQIFYIVHMIWFVLSLFSECAYNVVCWSPESPEKEEKSKKLFLFFLLEAATCFHKRRFHDGLLRFFGELTRARGCANRIPGSKEGGSWRIRLCNRILQKTFCFFQ